MRSKLHADRGPYLKIVRRNAFSRIAVILIDDGDREEKIVQQRVADVRFKTKTISAEILDLRKEFELLIERQLGRDLPARLLREPIEKLFRLRSGRQSTAPDSLHLSRL